MAIGGLLATTAGILGLLLLTRRKTITGGDEDILFNIDIGGGLGFHPPSKLVRYQGGGWFKDNQPIDGVFTASATVTPYTRDQSPLKNDLVIELNTRITASHPVLPDPENPDNILNLVTGTVTLVVPKNHPSGQPRNFPNLVELPLVGDFLEPGTKVTVTLTILGGRWRYGGDWKTLTGEASDSDSAVWMIQQPTISVDVEIT